MAIATAVPAVGALAVHVKAGVGAVASQAWVNPYLGIDALARLAGGSTAQSALDWLVATDPGAPSRQLAILDAAGNAAAFTGSDCPGWHGHLIGSGVSVQGNILVGADTLDAMLAAFEATEHLPLDERLMQALEAGQAAGGDRRGRQSAALKVVGTEDYGIVDLRVDDHPEPVAELRRLLELACVQLSPLLAVLPTRDNPLGGTPSDDLIAILTTPPPQRPQRK